MTHWHNRPLAWIGLRLIGLVLVASLRPQGAALRALILQSAVITPAQIWLAAACVISASAGAMLFFWGPSLWQPVIIRQWHGHAIEDE